MEKLSISERLAALKNNKQIPQNNIPQQPLEPKNSAPFPLKYFLILVAAAIKGKVYNERKQIFQLLADWMSPIALPPEETREVPDILYNYEFEYMARRLGCNVATIYYTYQEIYHD